ncbi:zinc dependent phospholipase C family protein [Niameybacter massiliensis]|uniref:Zinc dependent phospholipase C family protein n=1 Tax=Holtiella tumoricola TaxID=3018743 RepID=A0AA42DKK1_9FIRM|nr:zinc dependent phospholipase C family protein [Holtiella tumoricola]MDA3730629.1 zinc dependent phospholipase C family protein [Holtiella tumoricola]
MKIKTHYVIALEAYELIKQYIPVTFNERALKIGASMPDLAPHRRFKGHNIKIAAREWKSFTDFVHRRQATEFVMSYAAGMMSHYISDTFCYAHNFKHLTLREHRKYEVYMNKEAKVLRNEMDVRNIFKRWQILKEKGVEGYIKLENELYKEEVARCRNRHDRVLLDLYEAISHTAVWMLEIVNVTYPSYIEHQTVIQHV